MGAIRNLFNQGLPWAPTAFSNWGIAISDTVDSLEESNFVGEDDPRLTDSRTPLSHGNEAHSENFVSGTDVNKIVVVTEANYPAQPDADTLYIVF
jgi:hypothetical protein